MTHYGDITKLSSYNLPPVDVITGGSPCQDLSVAGKRAGLDGQRSGLFMEQIRIVKEMRENDVRLGRPVELARPRFMVWENVPGAFSSNKGEDFRVVLEETAKIADKTAVIPEPPKGKWSASGAVVGDGWSIAWRVHDAQFWGVPQRRKRIALIADFGGLSAPEICFERKGLRRGTQAMQKNGENNSEGTADGVGKPIGVDLYNAYITGNVTRALNSAASDSTHIPCIIEHTKQPIMLELGSTKHTVKTDGICLTLKARMGTGGNNVNAVVDNGILRTMTPKEIERLQGFPDGWTDIGEWTDTKGKLHKESSDSARYKALGNSIATPFWFWLLRRISAQYERPATLGSLFDGIGGFPYCWERCNGKGTALWASEIEEFPIAVTRKHFPEEAET